MHEGMKQHDCIVIGAGLLGMFTARELLRSGLSVLLIDRQQCGQESSWAGGGILSPLYPWRYPEPVTRLAAWSQRHYQDIAASLTETTGIDPQWRRSGMLLVDLADELEAESWARQYAITMQPLMAEALRQYEPTLSRQCRRAVFFPDVAQVRNPRLIKALRCELESSGVDLLEHVEVSGLKLETGGGRRRVRGVEAGDSRYAADKVVVCGGAWTPQILSGLDLQVSVRPVRGQMVMFKAHPELVRHIILVEHCYLIPRQDGRILAGSTLEYVGFDKKPTEEAEQQLIRQAVELVPALAEFPLEVHWAGLRPGTENDGIPYIGAVESVAGLYVNTGHFRNGVVLAPASARLLADIMLDRPPIVDPSFYRIPEKH